jgi:hypothetical protein
MSRYYGMRVIVSDHDKLKAEAIAAALAEEWPSFWEGLENCLDDDELSAYGEDRLCGGESEDEFSARIAKAVWTANGKYCSVYVGCTCLEDLPCERYNFNKDSYAEIMEQV